MKKQNFVVMGALLVTFILPVVAQAQWYRGNLKETLKQLEEDTDRFAKSLDSDLDHSRINGSRQEDEINAYVHAFEEATDRLKDRYEDRGNAPGLARTGPGPWPCHRSLYAQESHRRSLRGRLETGAKQS